MSTNNQNGGFWVIVGAVLALAVLLQMLGRGVNNVAPVQPDQSTFEHRYVTERLKREGYSQSEAKQAADAVIKFHNAQQNRSK